jgi:putative two-component system response regulator
LSQYFLREQKLNTELEVELPQKLKISEFHTKVLSNDKDLAKAIISESKICIVDDVMDNIKILRKMLSENGHKTCVAQTEKKALEVIKLNAKSQEGLHLILLDVMMEEADSGYKLCRALKADPETSQIPIIFLSARAEVEDIVHGLNIGGNDYIRKPFNRDEVLARVERNLSDYHYKLMLFKLMGILKTANIDTIQRLNCAAQYKDNETGNHVKRMSLSSQLIAKKCGLSAGECEVIFYAAGLHDIGKIGIPDRILLKPGKLTDEEWKIMKTHTTIGGVILENGNSDVINMGHVIAMTHQEKYDGSGYPKGLMGKEIPLVGRIVSVADVFDALTSDRPYKKCWSVSKALDYIISQKGKHFDPKIVDEFLKILPEINEANKCFKDTF